MDDRLKEVEEEQTLEEHIAELRAAGFPPDDETFYGKPEDDDGPGRLPE